MIASFASTLLVAIDNIILTPQDAEGIARDLDRIARKTPDPIVREAARRKAAELRGRRAA